MPLPNYSRVRLTTDKYCRDNAPVGTMAYIIEVYGSKHYEIEVSDETGATLALLTVEQDEVELAE